MISTRGWTSGALAILVLSASPLFAAEPAILDVTAMSGGPTPLDAFRRPQGMAVDAARGIVLVADTGKDRLVVLDRTLRSRGTVSFAVPAGETSAPPRALAVDARGRLLVVGTGRDDVEVMNSRGTHLAYLRPELPSGLSGRVHPASICVGASGLVYLLYEGERPGYLVMEPGGQVRLRVGFVDESEGDFAAPMALAVNADESRVAVVDARSRACVHVFDAQGSVVAAFGTHGSGEGTFSLPVHVTWGPGGTLWVTDSIRHAISVFDSNGTYQGAVGGFGFGPGQFYYPVACVFAGGEAMVLERAGARLQALEIALPESGTEEGAVENEGTAPLAVGQHNVQWRKPQS